MKTAAAVAISPAAQQVAFGPLPEGGRADAITRQLSQAIAMGLLPDGARLPSETELAASLGVSNVTLRESLAELRRQGLLETRRGRGGGSFVRLARGDAYELIRRGLLALSLDDLRDIRDFHCAVAAGAAGLAAARVARSSIRQLRHLADALQDADDRTARVRADARFHIEIAALSRSARLTRAELGLQDEVAPLLWMPGFEAFRPEEAVAQHRALVDALEARDGGRARELAESHVKAGLDHVILMRMDLVAEEQVSA